MVLQHKRVPLASPSPITVNRRVRWRKAAILGVGMLGGSLGLALRRRGLAGEVAGLVRREETASEAVAAGVVESASTGVEAVVRGADLVVLCTPVAQMKALAASLDGILASGAIVTDVGSAKHAVVEAVEAPVRAAGGHFLGSHPMAGSEKTGVRAAREDLFEGAVTVLTPTPRTDPRALVEVRGMWEAVGCRTLSMAAERHDVWVSRTSHLPHLVAAALAHWILEPGHPREQLELCATGFRDTTRVAAGSPEMWRDIAMANRAAILEALDGFLDALGSVRHALQAGDAQALEDFLRRAKDRRDGWKGPPGAIAAE